MSRPDMDRIKDDIRGFERPCASDSKRMYDYIFELEAKIDQLQKTIHNSDYMSFEMCYDAKRCSQTKDNGCKTGDHECYTNLNNI